MNAHGEEGHFDNVFFQNNIAEFIIADDRRIPFMTEYAKSIAEIRYCLLGITEFSQFIHHRLVHIANFVSILEIPDNRFRCLKICIGNFLLL